MNASKVSLTALVLLLAGALPAHADEYDPLHQTLGVVPPFKLRDQNGNLVERDQLQGKVCVVSFFFACCTGIRY